MQLHQRFEGQEVKPQLPNEAAEPPTLSARNRAAVSTDGLALGRGVVGWWSSRGGGWEGRRAETERFPEGWVEGRRGDG